MTAPELLIILLAVLVGYVYVGYPLLLWLIGSVRTRAILKSEYYPSVSIIIAAYNEEKVIRQTVENKLDLDYPSEQMEIIVASDGSTDGTDTIVESIPDGRVRLIRQEPRQGKTAALNRAVDQAEGKIIVFSDANSIYGKEALKELVFNFHDPSVGYVTGNMHYVAAAGSHVGEGSDSYMKYENLLRTLETRAGSIVGVDGGIDAVRKSLYVNMDPSLLPDLVLPLAVVEKGYRVVYEPRAILHEAALEDVGDEYRMRIRVALRAFHALWHKRSLLNPFKHGLFALQLFSHKWLRYLVAFFLASMLLCSFFAQKTWTVAFGSMQVVGYLFALVGFWQNRHGRLSRVFRLPFYFCLINIASCLAFLRFLAGRNQVVWSPRRGEETT